MRRLWVVFCLSVLFAGCIRPVDSARDDARKIFGALRANEQTYQQVLASEHEMLEMTRDASSDAVDRIAELRDKVRSLHDRLADIHVANGVRAELLDPILEQLDEQQRRLTELERADPDHFSEKLAAYPPLKNLFTPAIRKIRESYGVARQRKWRGNPLSA